MTDAVHETTLMRLARSLASISLDDACAALPGLPRDTVRAALDDLVARGKLRRDGGRWRAP